MKKSIFSASKLSGLNAVAKGTKTTNDDRPEITTGRSVNRFSLNSLASQVMGVQTGDHVTMFYDNDETDLSQKFFIAKAPEGAKLMAANKAQGMNRTLTFSYSSIWSVMIQNDPEAKALGERALVEKGVLVNTFTQWSRKKEDGSREKCYSNLAPYTIGYALSLVTNEDGDPLPIEVDGTVYPKVYVLIDPIVREAPVKSEDEPDSDEAVEQDVEEVTKRKARKVVEADDTL